MGRLDQRAREVFEHAAQHLKHAGFGSVEGAKLLGGMSPEKFDALAAAAERRNPKLCSGQCFNPGADLRIVQPLCPYCAHCAQVHGDMMGEALRQRRGLS